MMRSRFDEQLQQLRHELIEMGALCERVIALSVKALEAGDTKLAASVAPVDAGGRGRRRRGYVEHHHRYRHAGADGERGDV